MLITEKQVKQIDETKYLTETNAYRYRPIMRYFLEQYEKIEYWMYKEDVYNTLKESDFFSGYTIEECERDLETLAEWKSLDRIQDTKSPESLDEFKNKKYRYQMTDYAVAIERLVIELENMQIKTSSLEPKSFEKIKNYIKQLENIYEMNDVSINELWFNLNTEFKSMNENYQDFFKKFNEAKTEELLQSDLFLKFKSEMIRYLKDFIQGYQQNSYFIIDYIKSINEEKIDFLMNQLITYQKKVPKLVPDFDFDKLKSNNYGKWNSICKWFLGTNTSISEGNKLINATGNIIARITKYASSLAELHGNMTNRKEEYKHLCKLFDKMSLEDCHKLSSQVIGIESVRHFNGTSNNLTDQIIKVIDSTPIEIPISPRNKKTKQIIVISPIVDKKLEKENILIKYREEQNKNKEMLKLLIKNKQINLKGNLDLTTKQRKYILKLLNNRENSHESEFGYNYFIEKQDGKCYINSEDGTLLMNSMLIKFEGEINE